MTWNDNTLTEIYLVEKLLYAMLQDAFCTKKLVLFRWDFGQSLNLEDSVRPAGES